MRGHLTTKMPKFIMGNAALDVPTLMNQADAREDLATVPFLLP